MYYLRVLSRYRLQNSAIFGTFDANGKNLQTLAEPSRITQRAFLRVQRRSDLRTQRQLLRGCLTPTHHLPTFRRRRAYAPACLSEAASVNVLFLPEPPTFVGCGRGGRQTKIPTTISCLCHCPHYCLTVSCGGAIQNLKP